jgi:hypothetical protein
LGFKNILQMRKLRQREKGKHSLPLKLSLDAKMCMKIGRPLLEGKVKNKAPSPVFGFSQVKPALGV